VTRLLKLGIALVPLVGGLAAQSPPGEPIPHVDFAGPALTFDFPWMRIGVAEYEEGPTGTTVFYFPEGVKAAVDVRGGAPGTVNTDAVRLSYEGQRMQAVVFSGGSWYGLSAATGAANAIKALRAEHGERDAIAGVVAGIVYDVGARRFTRVTPDERLGTAALRAAREGWFPLGARGAGRFTMQGGFYLKDDTADAAATWAHSGQGGAFREIGPTKIAVFTVVNAVGTVVDRDGTVLRCRRNTEGPCPKISTLIEEQVRTDPRAHDASTAADDQAAGPTENTTLTLVVTNQKLPHWALERLAVQVHTSMARAIQPFATRQDGDVLYAVTTDDVDNPSLGLARLALIGSEVAWDAVLTSLPELPEPPLKTSLELDVNAQHEFEGAFVFAGGGTLSVAVESGRLSARFSGRSQMYFDDGRLYGLLPVRRDVFIIDSPGQDVVRFDRQANRIVGLTLNPGPWNQRADRRQ